MNRNPDPKHGRWILPVVVAAMVVFTYLFVSNLDPGTTAATATTSTAVTTTTSTVPDETTTTTTLAPAAQAYLDALEVQRVEVTRLLQSGTDLNDQWDRRNETGVTFQVTLEGMGTLAGEAGAFRDAFATIVPPIEIPALATPHADLTSAADALASSASRMVDGLQSSDTGELRRGALADFQAAGQAFFNGIDAAILATATATA